MHPFYISAFYWTVLYHSAYGKHIMAESLPESPLSLDAQGTHLLHFLQEKTQASNSNNAMCNY